MLLLHIICPSINIKFHPGDMKLIPGCKLLSKIIVKEFARSGIRTTLRMTWIGKLTPAEDLLVGFPEYQIYITSSGIQ
jgi:hypothetical protein